MAEKFNPDRMYTMWACVSPRGYYLIAFRTKKAAEYERSHYRPETRIEKIEVSPARSGSRGQQPDRHARKI